MEEKQKEECKNQQPNKDFYKVNKQADNELKEFIKNHKLDQKIKFNKKSLSRPHNQMLKLIDIHLRRGVTNKNKQKLLNLKKKQKKH